MSDDKYYQEITATNSMLPIANSIKWFSDMARKYEYALLLMVRQYCSDDNCLYHQHMFAGEEAFRVLGITLETPVEEIDDRIEELESEGY